MDYAWDPNKVPKNIEKHQVSFEEAHSVFADPLAISFEYAEHSETEVRKFITGHTDLNRL